MFAVHDTAAVPEPDRVVGVMGPHVRPGWTVSVRLTVPANWFRLVRVIVELVELPALVGAGEAADIVKSCTVKVTDAEWDSEPLAPVTMTCNVMAVAKLQDRTALPEPDTIAGETAQLVLFVIKLTTPAKPIRPVTVTFEVAVTPTFTARLVGLTPKLKSWTFSVTRAE